MRPIAPIQHAGSPPSTPSNGIHHRLCSPVSSRLQALRQMTRRMSKRCHAGRGRTDAGTVAASLECKQMAASFNKQEHVKAEEWK